MQNQRRVLLDNQVNWTNLKMLMPSVWTWRMVTISILCHWKLKLIKILVWKRCFEKISEIYQILLLIHSLLLFLYLGPQLKFHFYLPYSVFLSFDDFSTFNSSSGSLSTSMLSSRSSVLSFIFIFAFFSIF